MPPTTRPGGPDRGRRTGRATASRRTLRLAPADGGQPPQWTSAGASRPARPRARGTRRRREPRADGPDRDDTLAVLLMCCHPSLTPASAIPLTLRAVGGLTTAEIAAAFLVPDATMAPAHLAREATISRPASRSPAGADDLPAAYRARPARHLPRVQRGLREQRRHARSADLADEAIRLARWSPRAAPRRRGGRRAARAAAAARCPTPRAHVPRAGTWSRSPSRIESWDRGDRRGHRDPRRRDGAGPGRGVPVPGRDRGDP